MTNSNNYSDKLTDNEIDKFLNDAIVKDYTIEDRNITFIGDGSQFVNVTVSTDKQNNESRYVELSLEDYGCKLSDCDPSNLSVLDPTYNAIYRKMMLDKFKADSTYASNLENVVNQEIKSVKEEYERVIKLLESEKESIFGSQPKQKQKNEE